MMTSRKAATSLVVALVAVLCALVWVAPAGATQLVELESAAAVAANGPIPPVPAEPLEEAKEVCGSSTATWGSELLTTEPKNIKVPNEWGDIVAGKEMMVSGTIHNVSFPGDADIPIDHPFSADTTFDVTLDEPYWSLARELTAEKEGQPSKHELHMELETGAFPHLLPQHVGPNEGQPWDLLESEVKEREAKGEPTQTLLDDAQFNLQSGYIPQEGDRIAMRGRWVIDCGHGDYHGELHPITFMAFGHEEGKKTVVHVLANGYRVTQLYGAGIEELNPPTPKGKTLPGGFEESVNTLVNRSLFIEGPHPLQLLVGLEKTLPSTAPFKVCAPEGDVGKKQLSEFSFVKRSGVKLEVKHPLSERCTTVTATVNPETYKVFKPHPRQCDMPWPWVSAAIGEALGLTGQKANEAESIRVNATGGTFTITYGTETTGPISYNATATQVREALEALPAIGAGNIVVLGGPGGEKGGTPYTLVFVGALGERSITPVTTNTASLTGGAKLATVIVLRPGGELDLHRFILSEIEQKAKVGLEEAGLKGAITRIEANMALNPHAACTDPPSAPVVNLEKHQTTLNTQAFPYYGEVKVEVH